MINFDSLQPDTKDPGVLFRVTEPDLNLVITYLVSDGRTFDEDVLYNIEQIDDQWFVIVNNPLLESQVESSINNHGDEYGIDMAKTLPSLNLVYFSMEEIVERCIGPHQEQAT
jgi:hypothetical protein